MGSADIVQGVSSYKMNEKIVFNENYMWLNILKGTSCRKTSFLSYGDAELKYLKI